MWHRGPTARTINHRILHQTFAELRVYPPQLSRHWRTHQMLEIAAAKNECTSIQQKQITRRRFITITGALVVTPSRSIAQSNADFSALLPHVDTAWGVTQLAAVTAPYYPEDFGKYMYWDLEGRRKALIAAFDIIKDREIAIEFVESLPTAVSPALRSHYDPESIQIQLDIIGMLSEFELPIIPDYRSAAPVDLPTVVPSADDTDIIVLMDILLETIGIVGSKKSLIVEAMNSDERIKDALNNALGTVSTKSWEDIAPSLENLFKATWVVIKSADSTVPDSVKRSVAFKMAIRCVPFLGHAYLIGCLVMAIRANYHRFSFAK